MLLNLMFNYVLIICNYADFFNVALTETAATTAMTYESRNNF